MPLKRGRKVDELNRALKSHDSFQAKVSLDAKAKEMEAAVLECTGEDPLSAWIQLVKWFETNMPEDTRKKFGVLEKCTRELKDLPQYKNDIRYVRLWIQYADLVSNPKDIFKYLYQNKIGERVALFYVGWAWVLESMANYAQAHKVYLKATQKKVQPEDLLDRKYKEFQRRMSRHWLKVSTADGHDATDAYQRFALEDISTDGADIERFGNSENFRRYAQAQAEKMQRANAHKPVFTVYEDPSGHEVDSLDPGSDWKKLDTVRHQNKENDAVPTKWSGGPLHQIEPRDGPQTLHQPPRPQSSLKVFVDDEFSSRDLHRSLSTNRGHSLTLRQRIEGTSTEEEQLARQPLKNFAAPKIAQTPASKPPRLVKTEAAQGEKFGFDMESLRTKTGEILCFEEVRAKRVRVKMAERRMSQASGAYSFLADEKSSDSIPRQVQNPTGVRKAADPRLEARVSKSVVSTANLDVAAQEDMTINTRLAMEDVNSMFCSPSREEKEPTVQGTVWEVTEPVERKLHFSIFEDSVEVSINPNDLSLRNDVGDQAQSTSFQVYSDAQDLQPPPRTASKVSTRNPLSSRDDLAQHSRLTNKDMLLKIQTDEEPDESVVTKTKDKAIVAHPQTRPHSPNGPRPPRASNTITSSVFVDPYAAPTRKLMLESVRVLEFGKGCLDVHNHQSKLPAIWSPYQQRRRLKTPVTIQLDENHSIHVVGFLGSGAFAQVFSVKAEGIEPAPKSMAWKVEKTKHNLLWELFITTSIRRRTPHPCVSRQIPSFSRLDVFSNGAAILMERAPAGTLHDLLNVYRKAGKPFPETLAIHYTIRMLFAVEAIHQAQILHGDIKPDNWLLISTQPDESLSRYMPQVMSSSGDLRLIDFGRAIDMTHFPAGTKFGGDCHVKGFQTVEMKTKRPWTTQIDTFGVCGTVHCMLFGSYMEIAKKSTPGGSTKWSICQSLKRYWQVPLWKAFFDAFLNVESCEKQPSVPSFRRKFERYFEENNYRQEELQELLASQERLLSKPKC